MNARVTISVSSVIPGLVPGIHRAGQSGGSKGGASPDQAVDDRLANALEAAAQDTGFDLNVNSTQRDNNRKSPHKDGRAADINRVNGRRVSDPAAKDDVDRLAKSLAEQPGVSQVISPDYSVNIAPDGTKTPITDKGILNDHKNHIHVGVYAQ